MPQFPATPVQIFPATPSMGMRTSGAQCSIPYIEQRGFNGDANRPPGPGPLRYLIERRQEIWAVAGVSNTLG